MSNWNFGQLRLWYNVYLPFQKVKIQKEKVNKDKEIKEINIKVPYEILKEDDRLEEKRSKH